MRIKQDLPASVADLLNNKMHQKNEFFSEIEQCNFGIKVRIFSRFSQRNLLVKASPFQSMPKIKPQKIAAARWNPAAESSDQLHGEGMKHIQKPKHAANKTATKRMPMEEVMRRYCILEPTDAFKPDRSAQPSFIATQLWYSKWRRFKKKIKASEVSQCLIHEGVWRAFNRRNPSLMANSWLPVVSILGNQLDAEMAAEAAAKAVEVALASQWR